MELASEVVQSAGESNIAPHTQDREGQSGLAGWWRTWWRGLLGEDRPQPPVHLTEAEATERMKTYASSNGYEVRQPISVQRKVQLRNQKQPEAGYRSVYLLALGTSRPMPLVKIDAGDGAVLAWRTLPR